MNEQGAGASEVALPREARVLEPERDSPEQELSARTDQILDDMNGELVCNASGGDHYTPCEVCSLGEDEVHVSGRERSHRNW